MDEQSKELKQLFKYRRQAKQGLGVGVILVPALYVSFWILGHWFRVPLFIKIITIGIALFSLVGEIITFISASAKIRKAHGDQ